MFTILVTGGRNFKNCKQVYTQLQSCIDRESKKNNTTQFRIIHGGCSTGADKFAAEFCKSAKIHEVVFPANWKLYKLAAGPIRNQQMIDQNPNICLAFHDDLLTSKGTLDAVKRALKQKIRVILFKSNSDDVNGSVVNTI